MLSILKLHTFFENDSHCLTISLAADNNQYTTLGKFSNKSIHSAYLANIVTQSVTWVNDFEFKTKKCVTGEQLLTHLQNWLNQHYLCTTNKHHNTHDLTDYYLVKQLLWEQFRDFLSFYQD